MKSEKKRITIITAGLFILFLTPLMVLAIVLTSEKRINRFRPAKEEISIAENGGSFKETQDNSLTWPATTDTNGNYTVTKAVEVGEFSNPNGEYVRVRLVPTWYDDTGCVVAGVEGVTDIRSIVLEGDQLLFKDGADPAKTIITMNLDPDWDDNWEYKGDGCFEAKAAVRSGDSLPLLSSVQVHNDVMQAAETAKIFLQVDVLADSIQTVEDGASVTNPKW